MEKRVLITRWLESYPPAIPIYDEASVSSARSRVREAGLAAGVGTEAVETAALIASELTHNQLNHAKQGYLAVKAIERGGVKGLEVVAADLGPGLAVPVLLGVAPQRTTDSLGAGLEGVFRLADEVEVDTRGSEGVAVVARKFESKPAASSYEFAIAGKPYPGEVISGDDATCIQSNSGFLAAVCDGLGHGPEAREASNRVVDLVRQNAHRGLDDILIEVNGGLAETRGCVLGLVRFVQQQRLLQCVLAGDLRAQLYHFRDTHFFTSTPLIVGDAEIPRRRIRIEETTVNPGTVLAMFTDGLETKTSLKGELDVLRRPAIVIAQHLIERHSRGTDDALVFVARLR
jgi:anti-sigma regulatory factor (Ser/Thr protein kinase)/serine/threonine protein phosphatase PrpC